MEQTKFCNGCEETKPLTDYSKCRKNKTGVQSKCKVCRSAMGKKYRKANLEKVRTSARLSAKKYYDANPEKFRERSRKYHKENKEARADYSRKWKKKNPEKAKALKNKWYEANPEKKKEIDRRAGKKYRDSNKEKIYKRLKDFRERHRGRYNAYAAKRRSSKLQATPSWLTEEHIQQIADVYKYASALSKNRTDIKYHVDHKYPLNSDWVCGLHVPWNLQILSDSENCKKGNRRPQ